MKCSAEEVFRSLDAPLAQDAYPFGINDQGEIAGTFVDAAGLHRFLRPFSASKSAVVSRGA